VASTRLLFGIGRRGLVHPWLARVHPRFGTPTLAVVLMTVLTAVAAFLGDALLVPVTEVGSLAVAVGWLATCAAFLFHERRDPAHGSSRGAVLEASAGAAVSAAIVVMKVLPAVPGSFSRSEWIAFAFWCGLGALFWGTRPRAEAARRVRS
jgi:amino acid transporter